ncbi:MAG: hypothetical protein ACJZZ9_07860 [Cytophagales bacterium]|tara:strand:+ start:744 stop:1571 length:828 start_codon:yes stop_codon:yes gene_type:complete
MKNYKLGIIGHGYVGESQSFAFSPSFDVRVYDKDSLKSTHTLDEVLDSDFIFVCVPTPMKKDGSQDLSFVESFFKTAKDGPIYIIKSTIIPGTTNLLNEKFKNLKIIFSPEFLTERTAKLDILTQTRIILGGDKVLTGKVRKIYDIRFKNKTIIETDSLTAEYIKYMNNTFFASKVSIMNEFYRLANRLGVDWETALYGFVSDQRIGDSHLNVPGPDGKLGFGGTCFPKDINAFITFAKKNNINMNILEAAWKTNLEVRPEKDWENLKGRAVSDD